MPSLESQIRAWADHHAPKPEDAVSAHEILTSQPRGSEPSGRTSQRRVRLLAAAAVTLLAGSGAAILALARHDGTEVVTDVPRQSDVSSTAPTTPSGDSIDFDLLGRTPDGTTSSRDLAAATTQGDLNALWTTARLDGAAPSINFSEEIVVAITVPDGACPLTLGDVTRDGSDIAPEFTRIGSCRLKLVPASYVVALHWAETGDSFRFVHPNRQPSGEQSTLQVDRPTPAPFTNPGEELLASALRRLELEACCGEPSHGGTGVTSGAVWEDTAIPISGAPLQDHTFDVDGTPRVVVPLNDLVTSSESATIAEAETLIGEADLGSFVAFTCGAYVWTIGGAGAGERSSPAQVRSLAETLLAQLECPIGQRPVAPGHGDPSGN